VKTYFELSVDTSGQQRELLIPTMIELGAHGFMESDTGLLSYFDCSAWDEKQRDKFLTDVRGLVRQISANAEIRCRVIEEESWNEQWERSLSPIEVGRKLVVRPSWSNYENRNGRIDIQIDPKMSFGTGYHETTRLILQLMENCIAPGFSMLDIGTGTGILAIAGAKLGAAKAIAIDNDEWSILNAKENVVGHGLSGCVSVQDTSLADLTDDNFDVIAANITLDAILDLLPEMLKRLKPSGTLLLSGLLQADEKVLREELVNHHLNITTKLIENEWLAVAARRRL